MDEWANFHSMAQARCRLTSLRDRLDTEGTPLGSLRIRAELEDVLEFLGKLQAHYGLIDEVLARTSEAVFAKGLDGRYLMINQAGASILGTSIEEILGRSDSDLLEHECAERIMAMDQQVMSTGESRTIEGTYRIQGVQATLRTTETAWFGPGGMLRGIIGTTQDVTELEQAERGGELQHDRLRSLVAEIVIAEESLRQDLAYDLHENLSQVIALTRLKLATLQNAPSADLHVSLSEIELLVAQADRSVRSITFQLSPPSLNDLGLVAALEWLVDDLGGRYGLDVRIEDEESPRVEDNRIRVILFRAVRELLVNAARHSGAHEALVRLNSEGSSLRITVSDEGAGFDSSDAGGQGMGLFGIDEQLRYVGGSLHVDSSPGHGSKVTLTAPLAGAMAAGE